MTPKLREFSILIQFAFIEPDRFESLARGAKYHNLVRRFFRFSFYCP